MSVQAFGPGCTDWTPELQNCGPVVSNISGSSLDSLIEDNSQITNSLAADGAGIVSGRVQERRMLCVFVGGGDNNYFFYSYQSKWRFQSSVWYRG